jgi:hypothetical protein
MHTCDSANEYVKSCLACNVLDVVATVHLKPQTIQNYRKEFISATQKIIVPLRL